MMDSLGHPEWVMCFFATGFFLDVTLSDQSQFVSQFRSLVVIDCKDTYDYV